jgi:hypothetical protein
MSARISRYGTFDIIWILRKFLFFTSLRKIALTTGSPKSNALYIAKKKSRPTVGKLVYGDGISGSADGRLPEIYFCALKIIPRKDYIGIAAFCNKCKFGETPLDVGVNKNDLEGVLNHAAKVKSSYYGNLFAA